MTDDRSYRLGLSDLLEQDLSSYEFFSSLPPDLQGRSPSGTWLRLKKFRSMWQNRAAQSRNEQNEKAAGISGCFFLDLRLSDLKDHLEYQQSNHAGDPQHQAA